MKVKRTLTTVLALIFMVLTHAAISAEPADDHHRHSDHGFILLGKSQKYLYHLARYNSPHQYMAVFKIDLLDENNKPFDPQAENGRVLSALSVDRFLLPQLASGDIREFSVDIFDGYLRSDDKVKIRENIGVVIREVIFFDEIFPESHTPEKLSYVLFGSPGDYYLAHAIGGAPNYEQVLGIRIEDELSLPSGKEIIVAERPDSSPLAESSYASGEMEMHQVNFFVENEYILEKRILMSGMNATAAGFLLDAEISCQGNGSGWATVSKDGRRIQELPRPSFIYMFKESELGHNGFVNLGRFELRPDCVGLGCYVPVVYYEMQISQYNAVTIYRSNSDGKWEIFFEGEGAVELPRSGFVCQIDVEPFGNQEEESESVTF